MCRAAADFQQYVEVSNQTRGIFRDYDPDMQAGSLDEAYLDVTAYCAEHGMSGVFMQQTDGGVEAQHRVWHSRRLASCTMLQGRTSHLMSTCSRDQLLLCHPLTLPPCQQPSKGLLLEVFWRTMSAGEEVAETVRRRVREETGVTCSVGIAPNRMLAKVLCVMLQAPACLTLP